MNTFYEKIISTCNVVLICCMMAGIVSCKKDSDNITPDSPHTGFQKRLKKKWQVQSITSSRYARVTDFEQPWFEFLSGDTKYVVHDGSNIYYGTYITNATKDTITLNGFGIIAVSRLTDAAFDFALKKDGQPDFVLVFSTAVDPVIPSSPATELLCENAWTINWQIPEGEDTLFYNSSSSGITNIEVRFSKNGTYLNHTVTTDDFANLDIIKYWKWNNAAQTEILTSNSSTFGDPDDSVILINKLTAREWNFSYATITAGSGSR